MKRRTLIQDKRGGFTDIFLLLIFAFVVVIIAGLFIFMGGKIQSELLSSDFANRSFNDGTNYSETITDMTSDLNTALATLRWISFFLIMGMVLAIFVGSLIVRTRPAFFVFYILIVVIAVIAAVGLSNGYHELKETDTEVQEAFLSLKGSNWFMDNLPMVTAIVGIGGSIIMFISFKRFATEFG